MGAERENGLKRTLASITGDVGTKQNLETDDSIKNFVKEAQNAMIKSSIEKTHSDKISYYETRITKRNEKKRKGKEQYQELVKEADKYAEQLIRRGQEGYDTWLTAFLQAATLAEMHLKALSKDNLAATITTFFGNYFDAKKIGNQNEQRQTELNHLKAILNNPEAVNSFMTQMKIAPPQLKYSLTCDAEGVLNAPNFGEHFDITDKHGNTLDLESTEVKELEKMFLAGVIYFLNERQGYSSEKGKPTGPFRDSSGNKLTPSKLKAMQDDFGEFLNGDDYHLEASPRP